MGSYDHDHMYRGGYLVCVGHLNFQLENDNRSDVRQMKELLFLHNLHQHAEGAIHRSGHTLDVVITRSGSDVVCDLEVGDMQGGIAVLTSQPLISALFTPFGWRQADYQVDCPTLSGARRDSLLFLCLQTGNIKGKPPVKATCSGICILFIC